MNREIRFRAWNKEKKVMVYSNEDGSSEYWDGVDGSEISMVNGFLGESYIYEWMQFTGLKDKNGKEIWEADQISLNGLKYTIVWDEDRAGFYYDAGYSKNQHQWPFTCDQADECEVIGNTFEGVTNGR